jgi:thioredoxin reductase (NADPH)
MQKGEIYDVLVIGAGIAGLSAALYSARQRLNTLVVSKDLGGQLTLTDAIENYPAIDRIRGLDLAMRIEAQAKKFGAKFIYGEEIVKISKIDEIFEVIGLKGKYYSRTIILAFGKSPRELKVKGEEEFKGKGVSYCAICDAAFFKDKPAAVVGEGEPGLEAIELLSRYAKPAYYITSSQQLVGENEIIEEINKRNVIILSNHKVKEIKGNSKVEYIVVEDLMSKELKEIRVDGVIIEMGYILKTDFLKGLVNMNEKGEVIVDELAQTSMEGIFAAGDITQTPYKQAVIAAAEGVKAALSAYNHLRRKKGLPPVNVDWKAEKKKTVLQLRV